MSNPNMILRPDGANILVPNYINQGSDKWYIIFILILIGVFVYWYQNRNDQECKECKECKKRNELLKGDNKIKHHKKKNHKHKKKSVRFENPDTENNNDDDSEISLDSLDSSDHIDKNKDQQNIKRNKKDEDTSIDSDSIGSLDI